MILILSGCSASRRSSRSDRGLPGTSRSVSGEILSGNNLTNSSFYIAKAEIALRSDGLSQKFLANIRYTKGKYLISLRSRTGLEAARIFINKDTILANDRFNRVTYYGEPEVLALRYGIPYDMLPLIFGDFITGDYSGEYDKCIGDQLKRMDFVKGIKLNYVIDCRRQKIIRAEREGSLGEVISRMEYSEFGVAGEIEVPSQIKIQDLRSETEIEIKLGKVEKPWDGSVQFVPGARYDLIELK